MTEREQFETYIRDFFKPEESEYVMLCLQRNEKNEYPTTWVYERWIGWQASRRAAMNEAAKVCDELADGWNQIAQGATDGRYDFMAEAGDRCADEIRALSGPTET